MDEKQKRAFRFGRSVYHNKQFPSKETSEMLSRMSVEELYAFVCGIKEVPSYTTTALIYHNFLKESEECEELPVK